MGQRSNSLASTKNVFSSDEDINDDIIPTIIDVPPLPSAPNSNNIGMCSVVYVNCVCKSLIGLLCTTFSTEVRVCWRCNKKFESVTAKYQLAGHLRHVK